MDYRDNIKVTSSSLILTCNLLIADPSLLKYNSLAMALTFTDREFRITTLDRLPRVLEEDMDANEDSLSAEVKGFLSMIRAAPGAAIADILVNVDAICSRTM